jgi:hypothetical protein
MAIGEYPQTDNSASNLVKPKQILICNTDKTTYTTFKFTPQSNLNYKGHLAFQQSQNQAVQKHEIAHSLSPQDEYYNLIILALKLCMDLKINFFKENTGCCVYVDFTSVYNSGFNGRLAFLVSLISGIKNMYGETVRKVSLGSSEPTVTYLKVSLRAGG